LPRRGVQRSWVRELRWLAVAEAGTVFATVIVLQLWRAHPSVPFYSSFDVSLQAGTIKTVLLRGWYLDNPRLGFPTGANLRDFPLGDGWHFVFLRMFSIGSRDWALAMNTMYLGTFLLVAASAYLALRCLHTRPIVAAGGAIVTALLPYHFARNEMHLFLSDYSAVPLVVALAVAQLSDQPWLRVCGRVSAKRLRWVGAVAIVVWAGGTGTYYAVLSALLLAITGIIASLVRRRAEPGLSALFLATIIAVILGAQLAPTFVNDARHGRDHAFDRSVNEDDVYSLRPLSLLAPIPEHRIHLLGEVQRKYATVQYPSEGGQALGLVAAAGLVGLLACAAASLVGGRGLRDSDDRSLALLAVTALAFGITAGGGALLAVAGFTEIRGWNRISIFVAFIGVAAATRALDRVLTRRNAASTVIVAVVAICTTVAVLDQTSGADTPPYRSTLTEFSTEQVFVRGIERTVGSTAAILQLPYARFPESPMIARMVDYSHLTGFLHSDTLRWSYGAVKGRPNWQDGQLNLALPDQLRRARTAGFAAVWVDRFGYRDQGAQIQRALQQCLGSPLLTARDERRVLYDLRAEPKC
jgi:phosphoglycerol transferase